MYCCLAYMYDPVRSAALTLGLGIVLAATPSHGRDVWTSPHAGVRHLHRLGGGEDFHVVLIDLENPEIAVVATRPGDRFITTTEFARRYDTQVAINANFFGAGSCGLAMGGGELFDRSYEDGCGASMAFGRANEAAVFDSLRAARGPVPARWITEVLSGKPWLMRDGRATLDWVRPQHIYRPNPRTAVGITGDRRTLVMLAANGRTRGIEGVTGFQMVEALREFGVTDAVNLDGGGSTTLVMNGHIVNRPSDGHERVVMTHLGIRVRSGAVWWAGEVVTQGGTDRARTGGTAEFWVDARNTGRRPWRPVSDGGGSPVFELHDGAVAYTASVDAVTEPGAVGRFTLRWQPRAPGDRRLRARLVLPDGGLLVERPLSFDVAVRETPKAPARRLDPRRESSEIATASLGRWWGGAARSPSGLAWTALGVLGCAVTLLRRRVSRTS